MNYDNKEKIIEAESQPPGKTLLERLREAKKKNESKDVWDIDYGICNINDDGEIELVYFKRRNDE